MTKQETNSPKLEKIRLTLHVDPRDKEWLERFAAEWVDRRQSQNTIGFGPEEQPLEDLVSHLLYGVMEAVQNPQSPHGKALQPILRYEDGTDAVPPAMKE